MRPRKSKKTSFVARLGRGVGDVVSIYARRNGPLLAKGLGFSFLLGLIPLLFLGVSIAAYLYKFFPGVQSFVSDEFLSFLPPDVGNVFLSHITKTAGNWGTVGVVGVVLLVTVAIALFDSIERAMSTMLSAPIRKFHLGRLVSLALMVGAVLLFFGIATLSTTANYFRNALGFTPSLVYWGGKVISALIFAMVFLGLYYLFSRRRLRFWPTFGIALLAAMLWQLVTILGSSIIRFAGQRVLIYGALAWVTIFLIYMRLLADLLLFSSLMVSQSSPPKETA